MAPFHQTAADAPRTPWAYMALARRLQQASLFTRQPRRLLYCAATATGRQGAALNLCSSFFRLPTRQPHLPARRQDLLPFNHFRSL